MHNDNYIFPKQLRGNKKKQWTNLGPPKLLNRGVASGAAGVANILLKRGKGEKREKGGKEKKKERGKRGKKNEGKIQRGKIS